MADPPLTAERLFDRWFAPLYPRGADSRRAAQRRRQPREEPFDHRAARRGGRGLRAPRRRAPGRALARARLQRRLGASARPAADARAARRVARARAAGRAAGDRPAGDSRRALRGRVHRQEPRGRVEGATPALGVARRAHLERGDGDLAVFHWWLKALSDDEIGKDRLVDRYRTNVEVPTFDASKLAPIAPADRRLPRLTKVRYDLLYKHLRAHLPELRDVGEDFPSPERFEDYGFQWLDFKLVGEGRMLLFYGAAESGLHLIWMDAEGFAKSAYYPPTSSPRRSSRPARATRSASSSRSRTRRSSTRCSGGGVKP